MKKNVNSENIRKENANTEKDIRHHHWFQWPKVVFWDVLGAFSNFENESFVSLYFYTLETARCL